MPIYAIRCKCGHGQDVFRSIDERDRDLPVHCGSPMARIFTPPMVRSDDQVIRSMVDGKVYTSRGRYRQHLKEHGCIEVGNEPIKPVGALKAPPGLKQELIKNVDRVINSTT